MDSLVKVVQAVNDAILNPIIGVLFVAALAYFFWGAFQFIANAGNETGREKGKKHMLWGIIGLFLMIAVLSIIGVVLRTFEADTNLPPNVQEQIR